MLGHQALRIIKGGEDARETSEQWSADNEQLALAWLRRHPDFFVLSCLLPAANHQIAMRNRALAMPEPESTEWIC